MKITTTITKKFFNGVIVRQSDTFARAVEQLKIIQEFGDRIRGGGGNDRKCLIADNCGDRRLAAIDKL